jgi:hypothetical protein
MKGGEARDPLAHATFSSHQSKRSSLKERKCLVCRQVGANRLRAVSLDGYLIGTNYIQINLTKC